MVVGTYTWERLVDHFSSDERIMKVFSHIVGVWISDFIAYDEQYEEIHAVDHNLLEHYPHVDFVLSFFAQCRQRFVADRVVDRRLVVFTSCGNTKCTILRKKSHEFVPFL